MESHPWRQVHVTFPDWAEAERTALARLVPVLVAAEDEKVISSWFFIRKSPSWRLRYLPGGNPSEADAYITGHLVDLAGEHHVDIIAGIVYEPETRAFGGSEGMASAHRLFHLDSRNLLAHLARTNAASPGGGYRRELPVLLCTALLRGAGLDWYEQGDVWAQVADHRDRPDHVPPSRLPQLENNLRRLMSADIAGLTADGASLAFAADWLRAYTSAGRELADLTATGLLHRGLRAILAHHIIFAWNRHGLPHPTQAALAHTARTVVFGPDPTTRHQSTRGGEPCSGTPEDH
ncbi:thiopeptide-type bacteriocin biosynthesis protein [Streptomyces sp. AM 4-1-1]|uniref:thiopeptide-type bacteriocin biosynthesis protein n=1 Tax=Streptomyces sp. AM 4-1-1 TaxID=3028710 RepID=UPI0023B95E7F|nr:thiopeptide-type bacteriocin biosynthesis protein [Streptomyces sp. AM 4-1-1]WEH31958.1 thiopeptide-type bacteriocin biosynthesis protein [Streptomyces sp. AM 4-1-1]